MSAGDTNPTLDKLIADYFRAVQSGGAPDREDLISQHPDLAGDLNSFFANHDETKQAVRSEDATLPPGQVTAAGQNEDATIPPGGSQTFGVPEVGRKLRYFGDYELLQEIARGGMGVVYKARQVNLTASSP